MLKQQYIIKRNGMNLHLKYRLIINLISLIVVFILLASCKQIERKKYIIYQAPPGESLSETFKVFIENENLPVYKVKVAPRNQEDRWKAMDDKKNSAEFFDEAAFAYFDINDEVNITISTKEKIGSVKILPNTECITPNITNNSLSFKIDSPICLTIEINGDYVQSLHLFANSFEDDIPDPENPDVIYFGPGTHYISNLLVEDNKTVYIAGGAIIYGTIEPDEPYSISEYSKLKSYSPTFLLKGRNITFKGRGIIDGSLCPTHSRNVLFVEGSDINLKGIIIRDASHWTIPVRRSDRIHLDNLKLLGYRANSDGVDICNSRNVLVENCFIRTLDDLIVVKSFEGDGKTENIMVKKCVLWNEVAHALSIGAEIREDVDNVIFEDCDIIRDKGREWSLRVFQSDGGRVTNVSFDNIRIEETQRLISLWINESFWSRDKERGHIQGVKFTNISAKGNNLKIELLGYNQDHLVQDVFFKNITFNNRVILKEDIVSNGFVKNINIHSGRTFN